MNYAWPVMRIAGYAFLPREFRAFDTTGRRFSSG
jgi:hypothetical protein